MNDPASDKSSAGSSDDGPAAAGEVPWQVESSPFEQAPELFAVAAFAGGFLVARLMRRLGD